jgi:diguanylate cyclase (GGDEF)-like protein
MVSSASSTARHPVGDAGLDRVGEFLRGNFRDIDTVGRWGSEDFPLIMAETGSRDARSIGEHLAPQIRPQRLDPLGEIPLSICVTEPCADDTPETPVSRVEIAPNRAKRGGRDRV